MMIIVYRGRLGSVMKGECMSNCVLQWKVFAW